MAKIKIWTLKHAFRTEMHQSIHWSLVIAVAGIIGLQLSQAWAANVADINLAYELLK